MTSFTRMRWTGVDPISTPHDPIGQWRRVHNLLAALEHERAALETTRLDIVSACGASSLDPEALRRERRLARRIANLKWMCLGGGLSWVALLLLSF
jgi:hypothetical protein